MEVEHAFFHCAKAYLRSQLWQPETWPAEAYHVRFGPYFHSSEARSEALDTAVNQQSRSFRSAPVEDRSPGDHGSASLQLYYPLSSGFGRGFTRLSIDSISCP